ncbi:hypothetical protein KFU94_48205 [Chloroflexi bacterium TSY]|nr:hypothetical protein [Chloroflexi bacterium TSY]
MTMNSLIGLRPPPPMAAPRKQGTLNWLGITVYDSPQASVGQTMGSKRCSHLR